MGEDTVPEVFRPHLCVVRPARKCFLPSFLAENIPYLHFFFRDSFFIFHLNQVRPLPCLTSQSLHLTVTHWCCWDLSWLMWYWQILNWIVAFFNAVTWICQICYMDLSNLLHGFVKVVTEFLTLFPFGSLNPLQSKMYPSFSLSCYCFVPKTKKRSKNYASYAPFVSLR